MLRFLATGSIVLMAMTGVAGAIEPGHPSPQNAPQARPLQGPTKQGPGTTAPPVASPNAVGNVPTLQSEIDDLHSKLKKAEADLKTAVDRIGALEQRVTSLQYDYKNHTHVVDIQQKFTWATENFLAKPENRDSVQILIRKNNEQYITSSQPQ